MNALILPGSSVGTLEHPFFNIGEELFYLLTVAGVLSYAQGLAGVIEMKTMALNRQSR